MRFRAPVVLPLLLVCLGLVSGCGKPTPQPPQRMLVQTTPAESLKAARSSSEPSYIAIVRAENETDFSFKVGGILELIGPETGRDWEEGTPLKAGDVLARLKQEDFVNSLASAQARADLETKTWGRLQKLRATEAISLQELDIAQANHRTANAQLEQENQRLQDSKLTAPMDGVVLARYANSGATVGAGQRVLRFANNSVMSVELGVPDRLVGRFSPGKEIEVEISALEGQPAFRGQVTEVGVAASQEGRLFRVVIKVKNPKGLIRSGMTANVRVGDPEQFPAGAVRVPLSALVTAPVEAGAAEPSLAVFVIKDGRAWRRVVKTGDIIDSSIIVTAGLAPGEPVVTSGASFLYEGAPVEVIPTPQTGS